MDELRKLYESLALANVKTLVNSGNVVFTGGGKGLRKKLEDAINKTFGFHSHVVLRTTAELRETVARNPWTNRKDIEPNKLLVWFLADKPSAEAIEEARKIRSDTEEMIAGERELFVYFRAGMARPKINFTQIERVLKVPGTGRNWNTVTKLLEIAESIETTGSSRKTRS